MNKPIADLDLECISLVHAINRIPGLYTTCSCCGHGNGPFRIFFKVGDPTHFPILLYYLDPCHIGFRWNCIAYTDCGMAPVSYRIESLVNGEEAYEEAEEIARAINDYMNEHPNGLMEDDESLEH